VAGASNYLINEWTIGGWVQIANLASSSTSYAATGLAPGSLYYFQVAASNAAGATWADYQSISTPLVPTAAPSFTAIPASATEVGLWWNSVPGANGYLIDQWINGAWVQVGSAYSGGTSYVVTGLSAGTKYSFEVASYNAAGTTWAASQSVTTPTTTTTITVDHPAAASGYGNLDLPLFGANGPLYTDVQQGDLGDCWLLSSLAEVAARDPQDIRNMFTSAGATDENGTVVQLYNVRLFDSKGVAHEILVDTELPGAGSYYDQVANGVLWVALAEKAYAQANGLGYVTTQNVGTDSYSAMNGGSGTWALQAITGHSASYLSSINPTNIAAAWNAGQLIVICTTTPSSSYIVGNHCYAVVGYNPSSSQPFQVYNPWGTDAAGLAPGTDVYGLFWASASFLSQNFTSEDTGVGAEVGSHVNAGVPSAHVAVQGSSPVSGNAANGQANDAQNLPSPVEGAALEAAVQSLYSGFAMDHAADHAIRDAFWAESEKLELAA
jgi:hypothetical protein